MCHSILAEMIKKKLYTSTSFQFKLLNYFKKLEEKKNKKHIDIKIIILNIYINIKFKKLNKIVELK